MRVSLLAILVLATVTRAQSTTAPALDQAALEREFQKTMTGATLIGSATNSARPTTQPFEDRYTILRATKVAGSADRWELLWQAKVGGREISIPLLVPVTWAGDTPVISVTDMAIPGMGTYTARVTIYRDRYVGMWFGKNYGGHLWGRIERANATAPATQPGAR